MFRSCNCNMLQINMSSKHVAQANFAYCNLHKQLFRNFWTLPHPSPDMLHTLCVGGNSSAQDTPGSPPPPPGVTKNCRCRPALTHLSSPPEFASENCTRAREKVMNGSTWVVPRTGVLATTTTTQLMLRVCVCVCVHILCFYACMRGNSAVQIFWCLCNLCNACAKRCTAVSWMKCGQGRWPAWLCR